MSRSRWFLLVTLPIALGGVTIAAIVVIATSYSDSNHRWTAIAAILTGAALLAALVGLPIALYQLFAVERDIQQLNLVPSMHYNQLRGLLEDAQIQIGRQVPMDFGDQVGGISLFREAFFAHYPDLSKPFEEWDAAAGRIQAALASFAQELVRNADDLGVQRPLYDPDQIFLQLLQRRRPRLHLTLEEWPEDLPIRGHTDGNIDFAGILLRRPLLLDGHGGARVFTPDEVREYVEPLRDLCQAARESPQVREIADAQDEVTRLAPVLRDKIMLHVVTDTITVSRQCPICRRNLGL